MILFYLLVSVMPMIRHPLWSDLIGDITVIKYLGFVCAAYAVVYLGARGSAPNFLASAQARWFLALSALATVSYVLWAVPQPFEISPLMSYVSFLLFFFVTMVVVDSMDRFRWSMLVAIGSVAYASLHVLREWQKYGGMSFGYRPGWITGDPNYFSVSALLCLPLTFYMLRSKQARWERLFCQISLVLTIASLTLAGSRGAFLGLTAAAGFVVWKSEHRKRTLGYALAILVPLMVVTPSSPLDRLLNPTNSDIHSSDTRQFLWAAGVKMIEAYPITGIGLGNFKPFVDRFASPDLQGNFIAHNTYVEVTAEMGFPGILLFLAVIASTFLSLGRVIKATDKSSLPHQASLGMQAGLCAFLVCAFFVSAEYQKLFWLLVFLSAALNALVPTLAAAASPAVPPKRSRVAAGRVIAIAALALALGVAAPSIARAQQTAEPRLDTYGGLPVRVSEPTGVFHVKKIGTRWIFVTPEGNAFWLRGVYAVGWGDGGTVAYESYKTKYNSDQIAYATHALRRIKSWGFNAIGPYSSAYANPVPASLRKTGNPEPLPFVHALNASWYGSIHEPKTKASRWHLAPSPFKTLLVGAVDPAVYKGWPGHTPDVFDPNFEAFVRGIAADLRTESRQTGLSGWDPKRNTWVTTSGGLPHPVLSTTPWLLGTTPDDVDYVFGFGPGPEVPGYRGVIHPHIGWIVAVTRPTQTSNAFVGSAFGLKQTVEYADPTVHAKRAWRDYLERKYSTIQKLNAAWGASYTTFDSDGGWPQGRGVLDESGRNAWIGQDPERLSRTAPAVRADLDAFLELFADRYFKVVASAARAATPRHLVFSPAMLNGHKGLTRREILRAAGRHCDVIELNHNPDKPELIAITYAETGGKPMISWAAATAQPDSAFHAHQMEFGATAKTQEERATRYQEIVRRLVQGQAADGTHPMIGLLWWEYMDKWGEKANWGLVTPRGNPYDGKQAVRAESKDAWGYPTGGEDKDYGDFISGVRRVHLSLMNDLITELRSKATAAKKGGGS